MDLSVTVDVVVAFIEGVYVQRLRSVACIAPPLISALLSINLNDACSKKQNSIIKHYESYANYKLTEHC